MRAHFLIHHLCISTALTFAMPAAFAQVPVSGLRAAVDAAWQRSPQARTLEARHNEIAAGHDAARSWIAGSPTIGLSERSDRWTDRDGVRETEITLAAPVWLPGQKSARESLAQSSSDDLNAQIANARLGLAGEVRERLWAVAAAREVLAEAQDHQHHLEALSNEVVRRVKAGDLARTDGMLAQQEVLAAQGAVAAAQAKLQEAVARYRTLTGQSDIPAAEAEPVAASTAEPHPRVRAAQAAVDRSQASLSVVNKTRSEPPTVGVSMRRERDSFASQTGRSVGIAVQIPIGIGAQYRPLETAALTGVETARAEAAQTDAAVQADIEVARQQVDMAVQALQSASSRASLAREHNQLIEKAFRLGERGLADLLRSQALLHESVVAERQQKVAVGLAHARLNQALGIIP